MIGGLDSASPQALELESFEGKPEDYENPMAPEGSSFPLVALGERSGKQEELEILFQQALTGTLPLSRQLKPWEPATLSPVHLQMIMFKAAGMRNARICEVFRCSASNVSIICRHPYARYILARLLAFASEDVIDIDARFQALVPLAQETITEVMISGKEENRLRAAFGILNRTGYGEKKELKIESEHTFVATEKSIGLLADAIHEAHEIKDVSYVVINQPLSTPLSQPPEGVVLLNGSVGLPSAADTSLPPVSDPQAAKVA